jgi:signal transduction histidine kinase
LNGKVVPPISADLQLTLQCIVDDVVAHLGCAGAMVATLEQDNMLPVRAFRIDIPPELLEQMTDMVGITPVGSRSVAYLDDSQYKENLSVRAVRGENGRPVEHVVSDRLYDLFRPIVNKSLADMLQEATGIQQVIAVPFFLDEEVVGNLFAASRTFFSERDIDFLIAFGHQAATALQSQRHLAQIQAVERVIFSLQSSMTDETQVLQTIVDAVVHKLGYAGAMVATLEVDNSLPVRAYAIDFGNELLRQLESKLGVSLIGAKSVVYLDEAKYQQNLSVRAVRGLYGHPQKYLVSDSLHDLFRPIVNRPLSALAQKITGIKQVIAVPFFLDDNVVGNLFAASRKSVFSEREIQMLTAFGQQAAIGIHNARLYRKVEERRQIAQVFARMAFSASASVHALRNHIGAVSTHLQLVQLLPTLSPDKQEKILNSGVQIMERLREVAMLLDSLHEPWRQSPDEPTNVNYCLLWATREIFPHARFEPGLEDLDTMTGITLHRHLSSDLPYIYTSPDMLTEAFRILIKNAAEAVQAADQGSNLWLESTAVTGPYVQIKVSDDGTGIQPKNIKKIFELGWSNKSGQGMGFGLFWAKDYIEGLGGRIDVESVWQKGTVFTITLPVARKT